jgi:hypothetical protein
VGKASQQAITEESRILALESSKRKAEEAAEDEPASKKERVTLKSGVKHHVLQPENDDEMEQYRKERAQAEDPLFNVKGDELLPL